MSKQELRGQGANAYLYQETTGSTAIGIDAVDSDKFKIVSSATSGALISGTPQLTIDPDVNGDITLIPNGTGAVNIDYATQYAVTIYGANGALSEVSSIGNAGEVLTSNGAGADPSWQAASGGALTVTSLDDTDDPYTVLAADQYLTCNVSGGTLEIKLPDTTDTGRVIYVKDAGGDAGANNITITTVTGAVLIDGATTFVMNTAYEAVSIVWTGSAYEIF